MINVNLTQAQVSRIINSSVKSISRAFFKIQNDNNTIGEGNLEKIDIDNKKINISNIRRITKELFSNNLKPINKKVNVFYNFKGGTGKTSLCFQVATHLAIMGFNVLALDLDPQAHLSLAMQVPEDYTGNTIYDILINGESIEKSKISVFEGLDLLPSNISVTRIEFPLGQKAKREEKLKNIIDPIKHKYDFILIDTNPTFSNLNMNALIASDTINIVCETQPFSLAGLRVLIDELVAFYKEMELIPNINIIPNKYELKTAIAQEVLGALRNEYREFVCDSVVRRSEDLNLASKMKLPLSSFCKKSSIALEDIIDLTHEIVKNSSTKSSLLNAS